MDKIIKKYIVSCPYCEKAYTIEIVDGTEFRCPSCGGAGNLQNATEVKELPKEKIVYVKKKKKRMIPKSRIGTVKTEKRRSMSPRQKMIR